METPGTGQYDEFSSVPSTRLDPGRLEQRIHYGEYECDKDDATLSRKPEKQKQMGKTQAGHVYQEEQNLTSEVDKKYEQENQTRS